MPAFTIAIQQCAEFLARTIRHEREVNKRLSLFADDILYTEIPKNPQES